MRLDLSLAVVLLAFACSDGVVTATSALTPATTTGASPAPVLTWVDYEITSSIDFTPDELIERWNAAADIQDPSLVVHEYTISPGEVQDVLEAPLTESTTLFGLVNKGDGTLRALILLTEGGDDPAPRIAEILPLWFVLIGTADQQLSADQKGQILERLGVVGEGVSPLSINSTANRRGLLYEAVYDGELNAYFFGVSASQDR